MRKWYLTSFFVSITFVLLIIAVPPPDSLNIDFFKTLAEKKLSDATGMDVRISGSMGLTFLPEQLVLLEKVTIKNRDSTLASIDMAAVHLNLLPFLMKKEGVDKIELFNPSIYIERDENGRLNIEPVLNKLMNGDLPGDKAFIAESITVVDGAVSYSDFQNGHDIKLDGLNVLINDLDLGSDFPENISFTGSVGIKKLSTELVAFSDVSMHVYAGEGLYNISRIKLGLLGGAGEGRVQINAKGDYPVMMVRSDLSALKLKELSKAFNKEDLLEGAFDLSLDITMQATGTETIRTVNGTFMLSGESIVVNGYDIDSMLRSYRRTQKIGVMDIGAFFVAGPLGIVFSKGVEFGELYSATRDKEGEVREFMSSWEINDGVASTRDVAFATDSNRLALNGKLDLVNGTYNDVVASVIDERGCPEFTQRIEGPLDDPQFEKPPLVKTVFGAVRSLIKKAGDMISGGECTVIYAGAVHHPQTKVQ